MGLAPKPAAADTEAPHGSQAGAFGGGKGEFNLLSSLYGEPHVPRGSGTWTAFAKYFVMINRLMLFARFN